MEYIHLIKFLVQFKQRACLWGSVIEGIVIFKLQCRSSFKKMEQVLFIYLQKYNIYTTPTVLYIYKPSIEQQPET